MQIELFFARRLILHRNGKDHSALLMLLELINCFDLCFFFWGGGACLDQWVSHLNLVISEEVLIVLCKSMFALASLFLYHSKNKLNYNGTLC